VRRFVREEDKAGKIKFIRKGRCLNQPQARNFGLEYVNPDTDWVWQVDCDEFYQPEQALRLRSIMANVGADVGAITLSAKCFYFDFSLYKVESFARLYRYFPEMRFVSIASPTIQGRGIHLDDLGRGALGPDYPAHLPPPDQEPPYEANQYFHYFHYSYVGPEWTRIKACMGEDLSAESYRAWWNGIFSQYDGANLEELYERNGGGVHVMGGGPLSQYTGPHPAVLDDHPLRHWRWEKSGER
jgi:hypothetical protein